MAGEELVALQGEIATLRQEMHDLQTEMRTLMHLVQASHEKMNHHVDFVESVYSAARHPIMFLQRRLEHWSGRRWSALPLLEKSEPNSLQH